MQLEQQYEGRDDKPPLFGLPFSVKESIGVSIDNLNDVGSKNFLELPPPPPLAHPNPNISIL